MERWLQTWIQYTECPGALSRYFSFLVSRMICSPAPILSTALAPLFSASLRLFS
jgi:hypothetical protein